MADEQRASHPSWLGIGALGCAGVVGIVVLLLGGIAGLTFWGYRHAIGVREDLDRTYGTYDSYRPSPDGTIQPDRMRHFLTVRQALMPRCPEVTNVTGSFRAVDEMAGQHAPDVGELFSRVGRVVKTFPSMGLIFGEYVSDRNVALRNNQMGLGEYTWIYAVGYFAYLKQPPTRVLDERDRPSLFPSRVFPAVAKAIERHVAEGGPSIGAWADELARLQADPARVPFRDGLPAELAASLAPFQGALQSFACPAAAELDLTLTVRRESFGYDHR